MFLLLSKGKNTSLSSRSVSRATNIMHDDFKWNILDVSTNGSCVIFFGQYKILLVVIVVIIVIIIGKTALFEPYSSVKKFRQTCLFCRELDLLDFTSLHFATAISFKVQCCQPCSQSPTWRARSLYLCPPRTRWPSYTLRHQVSFSSPSMTRKATVEVNLPAHGTPLVVRNYFKFLFLCTAIKKFIFHVGSFRRVWDDATS
jgi:hypothetical protein